MTEEKATREDKTILLLELRRQAAKEISLSRRRVAVADQYYRLQMQMEQQQRAGLVDMAVREQALSLYRQWMDLDIDVKEASRQYEIVKMGLAQDITSNLVIGMTDMLRAASQLAEADNG